MRKRNKIIGLLLCLCLALSLGLLPALADGAEEERTVSPWAEEELRRAEDFGLLDVGTLPADDAARTEPVTDWTRPITRAQFLRFALSYAAAMNHSDREGFQMAVDRLLAEKDRSGQIPTSPFSDDNSREAIAAYTLGIAEGRGGGIFDPNALITRQEAAVILCRTYAACGGEVSAEREDQGFSDGEAVAPWAAEAVRFLHGRDVLRGVGKDRFDPLGYLTVEQCAVCFLRLSEELPVSFLKGNAPHRFTQEEVISAIQPADGITRWDGPLAVFIRRDEGAVLGDTAYFLAYADGGIRSLAAGVPSHSYGFPFDTAGFSEDGTVFTYTVTVKEDEYHTVWRDGEPAERVLLAEAGVYTVVIDVPIGTQTVAREPLEPKEGRWDDVPEGAWYREAAAYCDDLGLLSETEKRRYEPEGTVTLGQMTEAFAHAYAGLTTGIWGLPLRPENWGEAVMRLADGRELEAFKAWETARWRTWNGPMNKEPWHYSIRITEAELLDRFPELETGEAFRAEVVLDMGDKQVAGTLTALLQGDLEDGGPALLFFPEETSDYQNGGLLEPGAPTPLFRCAQPGGEGSSRGIYFLAEKGIWYCTDPAGESTGKDLLRLLDGLRRSEDLPEETFRPAFDVTPGEGTAWGEDLEPLYRAGILRPEDPDWAFDPDAALTRSQLAAVLWRLLNPDVRA